MVRGPPGELERQHGEPSDGLVVRLVRLQHGEPSVGLVVRGPSGERQHGEPSDGLVFRGPSGERQTSV